MQNSHDVNSASIGGLIQPIRHHVGDPAIEREVFALQPNQISPIIPVGEQFAILKCEGQLPARNVPLETVRDELTEQIQEDKLRDVASKLFKQLQNAADDAKRVERSAAARPDAGRRGHDQRRADSATRNWPRNACCGTAEEVLEVEISHLLLQQALAEGQPDRHASRTSTTKSPTPPSSPAWSTRTASPTSTSGFKTATEEQGVTKDQYMRDSVWPSAALKKLTGGTIQVTNDDLQKGFDANYGERVRCRAIVLANMRRAQEVWAKARQNTSLDYFGDLAEEYSIEPQQQGAARRSAADPPLRRPAAARRRGLRTASRASSRASSNWATSS